VVTSVNISSATSLCQFHAAQVLDGRLACRKRIPDGRLQAVPLFREYANLLFQYLHLVTRGLHGSQGLTIFLTHAGQFFADSFLSADMWPALFRYDRRWTLRRWELFTDGAFDRSPCRGRDPLAVM
jgi:hypothetical protein